MTTLRATLIAAGLLLAAATAGAQTVHPANKVSLATSATSYRFDGARHLYDAYPERIARGRMLPMLHSVVVAEVDLDARGNVRGIRVLRAPADDPEAAAQVREMIRQASPLPAPVRMGGTRYREIWRLDEQGRFQLETLSDASM